MSGLSGAAREALAAAKAVLSPVEVDLFGDVVARALEAVDGEGRLVGAHSAAELLRLRARVAELEAQRDRRRARLVALQNDALDMRCSLSPNGGDRKVPFPLGETLTPAVDWLIARVDELEQERHDTNEVLDDVVQELRRRERGPLTVEAAPPRPFVEVAEERSRQGTDTAVRAAWRMLAREEREDPHDSPLHHAYRDGRDMPETPYVSRPLPPRDGVCAAPGCGHSGADHQHADSKCWATLPRRRQANGVWGAVQSCYCEGFVPETGGAE